MFGRLGQRLSQLMSSQEKKPVPPAPPVTPPSPAAKGPVPDPKSASGMPAWKPMPPEFSDEERRAILAVDETAVASLSSTIISELLASIDKIPPFPIIANRLIEALEARNIRTDVVEKLITQDSVIAAKILSVANSPVYGLSAPVETLPLAIRTLGLDEISRIAIAAAAAAVFNTEERMAHESMSRQQQLAWAHSLATARGAAWLAMHLDSDVQRAYVAGLIHDVGKPVALRGLGLAMVNGRLRETPSSQLVFATVERVHAQVGSIVADVWKLGEHLTNVVTNHHEIENPEKLIKIVGLSSMVDEFRVNPAQAQDLLNSIRTLAKSLSVSEARLGELEFELKKASAARL